MDRLAQDQTLGIDVFGPNPYTSLAYLRADLLLVMGRVSEGVPWYEKAIQRAHEDRELFILGTASPDYGGMGSGVLDPQGCTGACATKGRARGEAQRAAVASLRLCSARACVHRRRIVFRSREVVGAVTGNCSGIARRIRASRSALEGERKQVTVLFADVKGPMDLSESRPRRLAQHHGVFLTPPCCDPWPSRRSASCLAGDAGA
jgi:hypothetical protein